MTSPRPSSPSARNFILAAAALLDSSIISNQDPIEEFPDPVQRHILSLPPVPPIDIRVRSLQVSIRRPLRKWGQSPQHRKPGLEDWPLPPSHPQSVHILNDVSADMPSGSLTAIMGGSGSGKTSLLNAIADRFSDSKLHLSGTISYGNSSHLSSVGSSYVLQDDILIPTLTVRETLRIAANLRLPPPFTAEQRSDTVEAVIMELGLKDCADTRIGTSIHKGCSGGEKRRVSIGVQLLANPSVLFLDEPTTGLDSYSARQVCATLKALASKGRTVVISIHAPRSEIFSMFDRFILLSRGATLYSGPTPAALAHFAKHGYVVPPFMNPAEYLIDVAALDNRSEEANETSAARIRHLHSAWRRKTSTHTVDEEKILAKWRLYEHHVSRRHISLLRQIYVLTSRTFRVTVRDPMGLLGSLLEAIVMSIVSGLIFLQLDSDLSGVRSRQGALYTVSALQGYLILMFEIYRLTTDIKVFDRERAERAVGVPGFLISRRLARSVLEDLPVPTLWAVVFYWMAGFRADVATFFIFLLINVISQYITVNLALMCIALSRDFAVASLVGNIVYTLQVFCTGYFINAVQIPVYVRWLKWISFNFYTFGALSVNEFVGVNSGPLGQLYDCPSANFSSPVCLQYEGRFIVQSMGLPSDNWIGRPIGIMVCFAVSFLLAAGFILQFTKVEIGLATAKDGKEDVSRIRHVELDIERRQQAQVNLKLEQYSLEVKVRHLFKNSTIKRILEPVSARFEPGKVNAIMGPSGSGKTSLLQSIAQRLEDNFSSQYLCTGTLKLNGATPSSKVIKSVSSFVTQDDDALMPNLTVAETLRYAAGLRLPKWMTKKQKLRRADEVLIQMGLRDCANSLIGSEFKKGISGGEKRRVSIAIQILTDPKVLLLDEPTSGLDAFTAASVLEVLQRLANEGRCIIVTIHQPRADAFKAFDNVLLLARGGKVAFAGPGVEMLTHFEKLGFFCPSTTNPADFVLDLITVDLQHESVEVTSRRQVDEIINGWAAKFKGVTRSFSTASIATPAQLSSLSREMNPFRTVFPILLARSAKDMSRSVEIITARTAQLISISLLNALFFSPLKSDYESIQSRMGFIQQAAALYMVGMLQNLAVYPGQRNTFYREQRDGCYNAFTFLLSYTALELPFTLVSSVIFGILASYAINLEPSVSFLFIAAFNCFCIVTCGESIGIMFCSIFSNYDGFTINVTGTLITIATTMAGIMSINLPSVLWALNYLSPLKYVVANMAAYSMRGRVFTCTTSQEVDGKCPLSTGEDVLRLYHFDVDPGFQIIGVGVATIVYRALAFTIAWVLRRK